MDKVKPEAIRVNLGLSQPEFAKQLGLTVRTYQYRISGKTEWKYSELVKLGQLGGIGLDRLEL